MNKKNLLFVIHRLNAGGAEKSLVSLLNALPSDMFEIDLLAIDPSGIFLKQVPPAIKAFLEEKANNELGGTGITSDMIESSWQNELLIYKHLSIEYNQNEVETYRAERIEFPDSEVSEYYKNYRDYLEWKSSAILDELKK